MISCPDDVLDRLARILLHCAAYFAPGTPIPQHLLDAAGEAYAETQAQHYSSGLVNQALSRLANLGLIERMAAPEASDAQPMLRVHRLIASFVQLVNPDRKSAHAVEEAVLREATRISDARLPGPMLAIQDHLRAVTALACQHEDDYAARLCAMLGWHLTLLSAYPEARAYLQESITRFSRQYGPVSYTHLDVYKRQT